MSQTNSFHYSVYGLSIRANLPMPALRCIGESGEIDIDINFRHSMTKDLPGTTVAEGSFYESPKCNKTGLTVRVLKDEFENRLYHWSYRDGTVFLLDHSGSRIWVDWSDGETFENTVTYLLGPVFVFALRLRGLCSLHASVVEIANRGIALLGPPGAGKSTTVAGFAMMGYPLLTDDVATLTLEHNDLQVQPGYPRLRLWPDSANLLFGSPRALPPILSSTDFWSEWTKGYFDLREKGYPFQTRPLPLGAVYVLRNTSTDLMNPMSAQTGLMALVQNTYANYLLDKRMRAQEFTVLSRLATTIPLREVASPRSRQQLSELCASIIKDAA